MWSYQYWQALTTELAVHDPYKHVIDELRFFGSQGFFPAIDTFVHTVRLRSALARKLRDFNATGSSMVSAQDCGLGFDLDSMYPPKQPLVHSLGIATFRFKALHHMRGR